MPQRRPRRRKVWPGASSAVVAILAGLVSPQPRATAQLLPPLEPGPELEPLPLPLPGLGPGILLDDDADEGVLTPQAKRHIRVDVGQTQYVQFRCPLGPGLGAPADAIVVLTSYKLNADPLIVVSTKGGPRRLPSFRDHDGSTLSQWREDAPGQHYVRVRAVGPQGGVIGILNLQQFGEEALEGLLSIRCAFLIMFDALFWDHFRQNHICPQGLTDLTEGSMCSGRGSCDKRGRCHCEEGFAGMACEHRQEKITIDSGESVFAVEPGHYQYYRAEVPESFSGGFLRVKVSSDDPVVVVVQLDSPPTKNDFDLSNFDDWINGRTTTDLKYRVLPGGAEEIIILEPVLPGLGEGKGKGKGAGKGKFKGPGLGLELPMSGPPERRRLWQAPANCPARLDPLLLPERKCQDEPYNGCVQDCGSCMSCSQASHGGFSDSQTICDRRCSSCHSEMCTEVLAYCNKDSDCHGDEALHCDTECGVCMACMDNNSFWSQECYSDRCKCCSGCFGIEAKCERMKRLKTEKKKYVYVGILNHRRSSSLRSVIHGKATIALQEDPDFDESMVPKSWIGDLYNPFMNLRHLDATQRDVYPDGEKFFYKLNLRGQQHLRMSIRLFKDRLSLLHLDGVEGASLQLEFLAGPKVTHVLSSTWKAPKTFFDFNQVHQTDEYGQVILRSGPRPDPDIWCAVFGGVDGVLEVTVHSEFDPEAPIKRGSHAHNSVGGSATSGGSGAGGVGMGEPTSLPNSEFPTEREPPSPPSPLGLVVLCVTGMLCCLGFMGVILGGKIEDTRPAFTDRIMRAVSGRGRHEQTASLTREGSIEGGYAGSEVIDRGLEDEYLHRGGFGDDGM